MPSALINRAIRALQDKLTLTCRQDPLLAARLRLRDAGAMTQMTRASCEQIGISLDSYRAALSRDPSLQQLEEKAIEEGLGGGADPGPHDAISRESPTAREGDLSKPRSEDDAMRPQMTAR